MRQAIFACALLLPIAANAQSTKGGGPVALTLTSASFNHQAEIPATFTCEGKDLSPALAWSGAPERTKSFLLVVDDPDAPDPKAPKMTWVHWVLFNIPAGTRDLPEAVHKEKLPTGTQEGLNDWKKPGWRGPCPPIGRHRYFFKLYALDSALSGLHSPTKAELERAMEGHIVAKAELIGTYQKKK